MDQEQWNKAKQDYEKVEIPEELSFVTERALYEGKRNKKRTGSVKKILAAAAGLILCFIIGVNTSTAFAGIMSEIPMLSQMAKLFTFDSYQEEKEESLLTVDIPEIKNTGNDLLEDRVNQEIRLKMNEVIAEAQNRAEEYRKAYLETGGNEEDAWKMEINVDYELKCSTEDTLSFVIWKSESYGSYYLEQFFYNIDLETGATLRLRDLLGPNYIEICNQAVREGIEQRKAEDESAVFFGDSPDDVVLGFQGIDENHNFYINSSGNVVLVFEKYSIAPGYMGTLEFTVPAGNNK